ncbi:hypothetical protein FB567DRAFT_321188 [Paraphoma chrysanthemicola]|uniref:Uncharacterized protein n=1 Tax=Paraphoma chrysanthemicola TaxID=798071 RepID=A0A8K0R803_9PLEO|nr:hypothetical protein FB567DRAFT_321188 [Paraphoma chrysanthemicola]
MSCTVLLYSGLSFCFVCSACYMIIQLTECSQVSHLAASILSPSLLECENATKSCTSALDPVSSRGKPIYAPSSHGAFNVLWCTTARHSSK